MISGKFWPRLATFTVGIPAFYALIFLLPHLHHLAFNVLATAAALAGGLELSALLAHKGQQHARAGAWLGALLPAAAYLELAGWLPAGSLWAALLVLAGGALASTVWARRTEDLQPMLPRAAGTLLLVLYPGLFMAFVVRLSGLPQASLALGFFFCLVFLNDTLAYLGGVLARGWSRLDWPVSPNKSAIGFACGLSAAAATAALCRALFPGFLPIGYPGSRRLRPGNRGVDHPGRPGGVRPEALQRGEGLQLADPRQGRGAGLHRFLAVGRACLLSVFLTNR